MSATPKNSSSCRNLQKKLILYDQSHVFGIIFFSLFPPTGAIMWIACPPGEMWEVNHFSLSFSPTEMMKHLPTANSIKPRSFGELASLTVDVVLLPLNLNTDLKDKGSRSRRAYFRKHCFSSLKRTFPLAYMYFFQLTITLWNRFIYQQIFMYWATEHEGARSTVNMLLTFTVQ